MSDSDADADAVREALLDEAVVDSDAEALVEAEVEPLDVTEALALSEADADASPWNANWTL